MSNPGEIPPKPVPGENLKTSSQYECVRCHRKLRSFGGLKYHIRSVDCLSRPYAYETKSAEDHLKSKVEVKEGCVMEAITAYVATYPEKHAENLKRKMSPKRCSSFTSTTGTNSKDMPQKKLKSLPPIKPRPDTSSAVVFPVECINGRMTIIPTTLQGSCTEVAPSTSQDSVSRENITASRSCTDSMGDQKSSEGTKETLLAGGGSAQSNNRESESEVANLLQTATRQLNNDQVPFSIPNVSILNLPQVFQSHSTNTPSYGDALMSAGVVTSNAVSQLALVSGHSSGIEGRNVTGSQSNSNTVNGLLNSNVGVTILRPTTLQGSCTKVEPSTLQDSVSQENIIASRSCTDSVSDQKSSDGMEEPLHAAGGSAQSNNRGSESEVANLLQTATRLLNNVQAPFSISNASVLNFPQVVQSRSTNALMSAGVVASNAVSPLALVSGRSSGIEGGNITGSQSNRNTVNGLLNSNVGVNLSNVILKTNTESDDACSNNLYLSSPYLLSYNVNLV